VCKHSGIPNVFPVGKWSSIVWPQVFTFTMLSVVKQALSHFWTPTVLVGGNITELGDILMDPWTLIRFNTHLDLQVKSSSMMCTKIYSKERMWQGKIRAQTKTYVNFLEHLVIADWLCISVGIWFCNIHCFFFAPSFQLRICKSCFELSLVRWIWLQKPPFLWWKFQHNSFIISPIWSCYWETTSWVAIFGDDSALKRK